METAVKQEIHSGEPSLRGHEVPVAIPRVKLTDSKIYALVALAIAVVGLYGLGVAFSQNMVSRQRIESLERELSYLKGQNAKVGKQAADFNLKLLNAESAETPQNTQKKNFSVISTNSAGSAGKISLSSFRGKEVVLYAWAPKCPYCKQIEHDIERFYQSLNSSPFTKGGQRGITSAYRPSPIAFLSVVIPSGREKPNDIVAFMKQNKLSYPALLSDDSFLSGYAPFGTPCLWHIGKDGTIKGVYEGKPTVLSFLNDQRKQWSVASGQ